ARVPAAPPCTCTSITSQPAMLRSATASSDDDEATSTCNSRNAGYADIDVSIGDGFVLTASTPTLHSANASMSDASAASVDVRALPSGPTNATTNGGR